MIKNRENDSTQNEHIYKHVMGMHYDAMIKDVSNDAKKKMQSKPYYMVMKENKHEGSSI